MAPRSPDLNPIENIWGIVSEKLQKRNSKDKIEVIENVRDIERSDQENIKIQLTQ